MFIKIYFEQILDEVERRRGISAALVYPFMRSLMESPFPAPGRTIKVKTFLPGAGNEVSDFLLTGYSCILQQRLGIRPKVYEQSARGH